MIGKTIFHYKIFSELGHGGMGYVYKAIDTKLDRYVALKFLAPEMVQTEEDNYRFIQEAKLASSLDHPNVCTIYEIGETYEGQVYIAMPYYEGQTLKKILENGPIEFCEAINIIRQILIGLQQAHAKGIVHRDIKPANIMITNEGVVKIIDFGLAKLIGQTKMIEINYSAGTVAYMSPEQILGLPVDHRTDFWAIGILLYEMICGELPFKGRFDQEIMYNIVNVAEDPLERDCSECEIDYEKFFRRAFEKNIDDRYASAEEMLSEVMCAQAPTFYAYERTNSNNHTSKNFRRKWFERAVLFTALFVTLLAIIGYWGFMKSRPAAPKPIRVVVIDFVNQTHHMDFTGLAGQLITSLEQSKWLYVLPRSRLADILKQSGTISVNSIEEKAGKQICNQAGISVMIAPVISQTERGYSIELKVTDPINADSLFTLREHGKDLMAIQPMIDQLSIAVRKHLKEREDDIRATSNRVGDITTNNFYAYQHYFRGEQFFLQREYASANQEFIQAVEMDPSFGLAYYRLACVNRLTREEEQVIAQYLQKAIFLQNRIPDKYRCLVQSEKA